MLEIAKRSLSTMNYFFLRVTAGKEVGVMVKEELEAFLNHLSDEYEKLPEDVQRDFTLELTEGDYFTGKSRDEAKAMLDAAILDITHNTEPAITEFYLTLFPSFPLPEYKMDDRKSN